MSAPPYQKWYWRDYFADTLTLSCEEHGAYLLLLGAYWMNGGPLPYDEKELQKISRLSSYKWNKTWKKISRFFVVYDGLLWHKRVQADLNEMAEFSQSRADAGRKGAHKRWGKKHGKAKAELKHSHRFANGISDTDTDSDNNMLFGEDDLPSQEPANHDSDFEKFWAAYPHPKNRGSKKVARGSFSKHVKDVEAVMRGVANYAAYLESSDWQRAAMAQTWLNQERWDQWQGDDAGASDGAGRFDWRWAMTEWRKTGMWYAPGESPGNPGCRVPLEILREFGF